MGIQMHSMHSENGEESRQEEFKDCVEWGCVPIKTYLKKTGGWPDLTNWPLSAVSDLE